MTCKIVTDRPCEWGRRIRMCSCDYPCGNDSAARARILLGDPTVIDGVRLVLPDRVADLDLCAQHIRVVRRAMRAHPDQAIFEFNPGRGDDGPHDHDPNHIDAHPWYFDAT